VKLSDAKGVHLMMASKFRYVDDVIKAKAIVESGILGSMILYENTFCSKVFPRSCCPNDSKSLTNCRDHPAARSPKADFVKRSD